MLNTLENLIKLARERKINPVEGSYTNKLLTDKSLSKAKVLEEIDELIEAIEENTNKSNSNLIDQINDLNKLKEQGIISDEEIQGAKVIEILYEETQSFNTVP